MSSYKRKMHPGAVSVVLLAAALTALAVSLQNSLMPGPVGVIIAISSIAVGLAIVRFSVGPIRALSAISLITYCQILIFVARPAYSLAYQDSQNIFTLNPYDHSILVAQAYAGAGYLAICIGYSLKASTKANIATPHKVVPFTDDAWTRLVTPLYLIIITGYLLYGIYVLQVGWGAYWAGTLTGRSDELRNALSSNSGYLYSGLQFATGAIILVIFQYMLKGKYLPALAMLALLSLSMFPQIASGSRSVFIPVVVALLYILHLIRPSVLKFSRFIIWGPVTFLLGFVAPRIWRDNLAIGGSIWDSVQKAMLPENLFDNFFGGLDTAMIDAFSIQISAQQNGIIPYQFGKTYLERLTSIVPRSLWNDKPVSVDEYLNSILFPETNAKKIGFAFGVYSEPTLNFGIIGVIVVGLVIGLAIALLSNSAARTMRIAPVFILLMAVSYIFPIMRGSLSFDSQRLLISLLPVLIVFGLARTGRGTESRALSHWPVSTSDRYRNDVDRLSDIEVGPTK